ncbi:hypothetical protein ES703_101286 [subsurface metagenome]
MAPAMLKILWAGIGNSVLTCKLRGTVKLNNKLALWELPNY